MALPASPPITLSAVCAEFGAPAGTPLGSFLRGGAYVPNIPANAGVPTSLPISLLNLLGAAASGGGGGGSVYLANHSLASSRGTSVASVTYQFTASGTVTWIQAPSGSGTYPGEWLLSGSASSYEVRVTGAFNSVLTGITVGVWQNAASTWTAVLTAGPLVETFSETLTVEIRPAGGGAVLTTAAIDLYADRF